ncbi:MAG TPA: oligosaccharide flippase family protein, partial [Clostridia bacterium]|nr:oligosaccharide flippase family protein [Clostridia bacterium]
MKQQSTSKGFAILSIASILCKVLSLVYVPLQTAIVGYSGNGMISSGYRIYIFMFSLSNAGLPIALSKLISESDAVGNYKGSKKI